ncbi:3-oxoacyl-ACP synthase [Streptomyces morookaense]|nr:3-oxoacyl-ACP synthase [Streptomyces morookaense]
MVITGVGPVSGIGIGARAFCRAVQDGRCGIAPARTFDATGFPITLTGEVPDFRPETLLRRTDPKSWGRSGQFAAAAARLAVHDAGLTDDRLRSARTAVVMGTASGESTTLVELAEGWVADGLPATPGELARKLPAGRIAAAVNHELGLRGEAVTVGTACSASNYALGYGYDLVRTGEADLAVTGGADAVNRFTHAGFHRIGALAARPCAPFDRDREGMTAAEGGAALVLEPYAAALERGAAVYAEVLGYGLTCDAKYPVRPDPEGIVRCIRMAHDRAGVRPADIDYVSAHGTGTGINDRIEAEALRTVFGDTVPPIGALKSLLGHTMGAAGAFASIATVLGIRHGFLPPTAHFSRPDPAFAWLDAVPGRARPGLIGVAQNNGFAFGGNNAIVVLGRVER